MNLLDYSTQCKLALQGADIHWRDTPIEVTPMARTTDPFRHAGRLPDGWWKRAEPRDADDREIILVTRDDLATTKNQRHQRENEMVRQRTDDALEPREAESIAEWFGRVAKSHDFNSSTYRKFLFDAMRAYASRFHGDGSAKKTVGRQTRPQIYRASRVGDKGEEKKCTDTVHRTDSPRKSFGQILLRTLPLRKQFSKD